ncbi:hypothetical protein [Pseudomonas capsici]|uniref:hypothetical protein n=1 Tax=Pseudomonas capsici TaxID=2810614 RepID=UPI0021F0FF4A|nr:hypothetical protein [Pseudomonas capsici]MCV4285897.1 hypothetical protein [Pseudomonas capsici]
MNQPKWANLLVDVERFYPSSHKPGAKLTAEQAEQLEAVVNASENFNIALLHGVAAVGELLAHASNTGGLDKEVSLSAGWLISSLALLSMAMTEAADAANYKLQKLPRQGGVQ